MLKAMWHSIRPEPKAWYRWRLNGAEVYLYRNGEEWRSVCVAVPLAELTSIADGPEPADPPSGAPVFITVSAGTSATLKPVLPERPYLIAVRNSVRILGGRDARFDVDLPVSFRFEVDGGLPLGELKPYILSNTWFGDTTGGILCYSLRTALDPLCRDEIVDSSKTAARRRSLARCSIIVRNEARTPLDLKQVAVYTDLLGVYDTPDGLATETVVVDGLSDGSLKMSVSPSTGAFPRLTSARLGLNELLIRRGVNFLRSVTGV
jgi:hypothetical protein